jgi:hypothetical protein
MRLLRRIRSVSGNDGDGWNASIAWESGDREHPWTLESLGLYRHHCISATANGSRNLLNLEPEPPKDCAVVACMIKNLRVRNPLLLFPSHMNVRVHLIYLACKAAKQPTYSSHPSFHLSQRHFNHNNNRLQPVMTQFDQFTSHVTNDEGENTTAATHQPQKVDPHAPEPHPPTTRPSKAVKASSYISDKIPQTHLDTDETRRL